MNKWINLTWKIHSSVLIFILSQICTSQWKNFQHNPGLTRCKWTIVNVLWSLGGCRPMIICDHPSISIIIFTLYVQAIEFCSSCWILFSQLHTYIPDPFWWDCYVFKKTLLFTVLEVSHGVTTAHLHGTVCAAAAWFRDTWSIKFVAFSERRNLKKKKNLIYNLSNNMLTGKLLRTFKK